MQTYSYFCPSLRCMWQHGGTLQLLRQFVEDQYRTWEQDADRASSPTATSQEWPGASVRTVHTGPGQAEEEADAAGTEVAEEASSARAVEVAHSGSGAEDIGTPEAIRSPLSDLEVQAVQSILPDLEVQVEVTGALASGEAASVAGGGGSGPPVLPGVVRGGSSPLVAGQHAASGAFNGVGAQLLTAARADLQQEDRKLSRDFRDEARMQLEAVKAEAERAVALAAARVAELQEAVRILVAYDV